jgi:pimeloyl-ACP methyl ester carboxylesterase
MQFLPVKGLPRWVRAPLMWGSVSPRRAPSQMERAMSGVSAAVVRRRIADLLAVDETAALRQVQVPALVLRAKQDRVISKRSSTILMENLPRATLFEVDAPHLLLPTRPAECAAEVLNFLRALN